MQASWRAQQAHVHLGTTRHEGPSGSSASNREEAGKKLIQDGCKGGDTPFARRVHRGGGELGCGGEHLREGAVRQLVGVQRHLQPQEQGGPLTSTQQDKRTTGPAAQQMRGAPAQGKDVAGAGSSVTLRLSRNVSKSGW